MSRKKDRLMTELALWGAVCAVAGLIAGAALGAVLSGGNFLGGISLGAIVGFLGAAVGGVLLRLMIEIIWRIGSFIQAVLQR